MQSDPQQAVRSGVATQASEGKPRSFPCGQCGADLEFHIGDQALKCPYCGHTQALESPAEQNVRERDLQSMLAQLRSRKQARTESAATAPSRKEVKCRSCAATVTFEGTLTSDACPFCGSPVQLQDVHESEQRVAVDGVLPFMVPREQAAQALRQWIESRWFAPGDFKKAGVRGKFQSVYLPFWTFDALTHSRYSGERGDEYTVSVGTGKNRRTETRVRWTGVHGAVRELFDDVLICALDHSARGLIHQLEPWPFAELEPYQPELLAGHQARTYDVELEQGFGEAKSIMDAAIRDAVRRDIGGDRQRVGSVMTDYSALTYKHLLLPVWLMAYRYRNEPYQVVINATTGEVQGERPYSAIKIALAVTLGLAICALIWWLSR